MTRPFPIKYIARYCSSYDNADQTKYPDLPAAILTHFGWPPRHSRNEKKADIRQPANRAALIVRLLFSAIGAGEHSGLPVVPNSVIRPRVSRTSHFLCIISHNFNAELTAKPP